MFCLALRVNVSGLFNLVAWSIFSMNQMKNVEPHAFYTKRNRELPILFALSERQVKGRYRAIYWGDWEGCDKTPSHRGVFKVS